MWTVSTKWASRRVTLCSASPRKKTTVVLTSFPTPKKETTVLRMMPYDVILSQCAAHLYSCRVLKRTSPLAVVSSGAYLSAGWYDALWTPTHTCDQSYSSTDDEKVTGGVKAPYEQACPLPDRKLRAAEALPCLICQRRHIWWWARSAPDSCFDFSPCDTSVACHIALWLSESLARSGHCSSFINRAHPCKQARTVYMM